MNKKAIVVYLDDTKRCIEEFSWLYKTWILWEIYSEYDLVVYHNPSIKEDIPKHDKIILRGMEPLNKTEEFWEKYPFVNSFSMFLKTEESNFIKSKYDFVLKTDCDVFLTKHILGQEPERLMTGRGGYMRPENFDEVLSNISRVQKELKLNNFNLNHIGSSVFGKTEDIIKIVNLQYLLTEHLLKNEWKESDGIWPGWSKGVASMYGIHMAVNNHFHDQNTILYSLDSICWDSIIDSNTFHIHAWHYTGDFSKHKWFKGEYKKPKFNRIPTIVSDYCLLIVSHTIEELIGIKENDTDKFSVIISTEWKSKNIDKLLKSLNNSDLVSQIVLIDTSKEERDDKLISLPKVKYLIQDKKLNDSLLRNLGVKESKNELLCFCHDNINFNVDEIFGWVLRNSGGLGCVGIHPDSLKSDREVIDVVKNYYDSSVWKHLIFLNKNNWVDVPKISDDNNWEYWIMKTHTPYYSVKTKTKIEYEPIQLKKGFNNLLTNDFQNHETL